MEMNTSSQSDLNNSSQNQLSTSSGFTTLEKLQCVIYYLSLMKVFVVPLDQIYDTDMCMIFFRKWRTNPNILDQLYRFEEAIGRRIQFFEFSRYFMIYNF